MNYIVRQRALLGISALLCTALLLLGCQDTAIPVGPDVASDANSPTSLSKHKPSHDPPGGGGGGGAPSCALTFDLTFDEIAGNTLRSDGLGAYRDGSERVLIFSNCGFRFDTNTSQKIEKTNDIRRVTMDLTVIEGLVGFDVAPKGIDMRFIPQGELDFRALEPGGGPTPTRLVVLFQGADGETLVLAYSCGGALDPPVVTRTDAVTWTVEGTHACLRESGTTVLGGEDVIVPFKMTLVDPSGG